VLTERLEFAPERDAEVFSAVPSAPAVFSLCGEDAGTEPYVSKTANLRRRLQRLLGPVGEHTRKLNLRHRIGSVEYAPTGSDFESGFVLYQVLRSRFPKTYANRLRFRFAPLVKMHLENEYARASITTRLGRLNGRTLYYGPFVSRTAAEKFMNDSLDFFKMRRCVEDLNPDPAFPGCIYSEMKMCLAPCFKGCSDEQYSTEVARVQAYFDTQGDSLAREFSAQREAASASLAFEEAAAIHVRLEKLKPILSQLAEIVRRIDRLSGLVVQPCHLTDSVIFFRINRGIICGPTRFSIQTAEHTKSQSMESRVEQALASSASVQADSALATMEHLALLKRWYYRSHRVGEIFLADDKGALPMRRIVRGIGRIIRGEAPEPDLAMPNQSRGGRWEISG
jgi:excinuclease ABC subunit C